jgi:phospholipid/cholesterol/gamma-HCH transport system substrate-binding protein
MPSGKKVSWAQLRVGITALVAMAILAVLIFLLTGSRSIFERNVIVRTYVDDVSGMTEGAPVRLNGILIGTIDRPKLSGLEDPKKIVEIDMSLPEHWLKSIPDDSVTSIAAASLLGDKFINITKGRSPTPVRAGGELPSAEVQDIPELMAKSANILQALQDALNRVNSMLGDIEAGHGNIGKLLKDEQLYARLNGITAEAQQLLNDIRTGKGTLSRLLYDDALYQDLRSPLRRLDALLAQIQTGDGTASKLLRDPKLYDEVHATIAQVRRLMENVNAGRGTAGKLLNDDQLYARVNELLVKVEGTVDRVNSGQGTLGQLMVNPQLYEALTGTTREFQSLAKDIRANPKKFLSIKLGLF